MSRRRATSYLCIECRETKPASCFRSFPGGQHSPACATCEAAYRQRRYAKQATAEGRTYRSHAERRERMRAVEAICTRYSLHPSTLRQWIYDGIVPRDDLAAIEERAKQHAEWRANAKDPEHKKALINARKVKRKRVVASVYVEPVSLERVAQRDGWRCSICGKKVTRQTWSRDHVVPLSKSGEHSYRNVTLAHMRCNSARFDGRLPTQAPLFPRVDA